MQVADATEPAPGGSYHLVIVFYLQVEPMVRRQAHRHAAEAVTSGGMLIVGHDLDNLTRGVGRPSAEVLLTVERVVDDLAGTGLEIERSAQVSRDVEQNDGTVHRATDTIVRARRPRGT